MKRKKLLKDLYPAGIYWDHKEVEEIRRFLASPQEQGTVDQLAIGVLFDRLAEELFPWCSTLTTRAKYLVWSPAVLEVAVSEERNRILRGQSIEEASDIQRQEIEGIADGNKIEFKIMQIESALSIALYFFLKKFVPRGPLGQGSFGSRNLVSLLKNRCDTQQIIRYKNRGLLSLPMRYPNQIYWGPMVTLGLLTEKVGSRKEAINSLALGQNPWSQDWIKPIQGARREIDRIWSLLGKWDGAPAEICKSLQNKKYFCGFELDSQTSAFLRDKILNETKFWRNILNEQGKAHLQASIDRTSYASLKRFVKDKNAKKRCDAAETLMQVSTPFREIYSALTEKKSPGHYDWRLLKNRLTALKIKLSKIDVNCEEKETKSLLRFFEEVIKLQIRIRTKSVSREAIELFCKRERHILNGRRKPEKRRLRFNKEAVGHYLSSEGLRRLKHLKRNSDSPDDELEVSDASFRLRPGLRFFKDIHGITM